MAIDSQRALSIALEERDSYTWMHCNRLATLAYDLGAACALPHERLRRLRVAAAFHDVGKIGVSDDVLLKPGRLDDAEWAVMKSHAEKGERILRATPLPDVGELAHIVRHHHESFDGSGYPDGLKGAHIPVCSRVLLVVDCYDALTSTRPYSRARTHEEAMSVLGNERGTKLDQDIFEQFRLLIERHPARAPA